MSTHDRHTHTQSLPKLLCLSRTQMTIQTPESTRYVKAEVRVPTVYPWHTNLKQTGLGIGTVALHTGAKSNCINLFTIVGVLLYGKHA